MLSGIRQHLRKLLRREDGQDLVEYALIVALISFGLIAGVGKFATKVNTAFSNIGKQLKKDVKFKKG